MCDDRKIALSAGDQTIGQWLPQFLKRELAPYPGRWSLVARMVLAATLSMLVIVTFRIPYGAIGVNCAFILSRENLTATARSGFYFILAFAAWAALTPVGARMFASVPITHFVWEGVTVFLCFFLLKTLTNVPLAAGVVVVATGTLAIWYLPGPAELNVELTLWQILATAIGALITFLVEVVFRAASPQDPLMNGIDGRLQAIAETLYRSTQNDPANSNPSDTLVHYALTGTSALRESIARTHFEAQQRVRLMSFVMLLERAIDLSVTSDENQEPREAEDLANRIDAIRKKLKNASASNLLPLTDTKDASSMPVSELSFVIASMELLLAHAPAQRIPLASEAVPTPTTRLFVSDAFTNPEYLRYALAGTAAAMLCYVVYVGLDWPGISTAVTTCLLTALSNIGSSRQKQLLRIVGASIGGFVFGLGSQMFVLPYIDSIVGLTLLVAAVTAVSAYVATSSSRLSYVGLQMAFAFYLINVTDFSISLDLTIGRDRAVGILLGIAAMWLIFDRLYMKPACVAMVAGLAQAARSIASLVESSASHVEDNAAPGIQSIRASIPVLLASVHAEADAVLFEGGPSRLSMLAARDRVRRWSNLLQEIYLQTLPLLDATIDRSMLHPDVDIDTNSLYSAAAELRQLAAILESQLNLPTGKQQTMQEKDELPLFGTDAEQVALPIRRIDHLVRELACDVGSRPVFSQ